MDTSIEQLFIQILNKEYKLAVHSHVTYQEFTKNHDVVILKSFEKGLSHIAQLYFAQDKNAQLILIQDHFQKITIAILEFLAQKKRVLLERILFLIRIHDFILGIVKWKSIFILKPEHKESLKEAILKIIEARKLKGNIEHFDDCRKLFKDAYEGCVELQEELIGRGLNRVLGILQVIFAMIVIGASILALIRF